MPRRSSPVRLAALCAIAVVGAVVFRPNVEASVTRSEDQITNVRVVDGDTIAVGEERIRVANIDTPETGSRARCASERDLAEQATARARAVFESAESIRLRRLERVDRYGRTLAHVSVDGRDFGEVMVAAGLARPWNGRRANWCGGAA